MKYIEDQKKGKDGSVYEDFYQSNKSLEQRFLHLTQLSIDLPAAEPWHIIDS